MRRFWISAFTRLLLVAWLSACTAFPPAQPAPANLPPSRPATAIVATATPALAPTGTLAPSPAVTVTPTASPVRPATATVAAASGKVRACAFIPGKSVPAQMPAEVLHAVLATPTLPPSLPANHPVSAEVTEKQLRVFQQAYDRISRDYVYRDFNGLDWKATGAHYEALIKKGLTQEDFYRAMKRLVDGLGDGHSAFLTPEEVKALAKEQMGKIDFVGIGAFTDFFTLPGEAIITAILPGSPAEEAGLQVHDTILKVDGGAVFDENQQPRTLGKEGTPVTITVQTPGQPARDLKLVRRRITSQPKVDYCLFPGTRLGYIRWNTFADTTVVSQTIAALKGMNAGQPIQGLVLDNRYNDGGLVDVMTSLLGLFTRGKQGDFISPQNASPLNITPRDQNGSQTIPLVVLIGPNTQSAAEYASGLLGLTRDATLVGQNTAGHVEELYSYDFEDGARVMLAIKTFQPVGLSNNAWEHTGVAPDERVPERWDLFTEATDPAIAKAVEILIKK